MEHSPIVRSAKYGVTNEFGDETWYDFDLDLATQMPEGKLYVFDCRIGEYIEVSSLEQGRAIEADVCACYQCPPPDLTREALRAAASERGVTLVPFTPTMRKVGHND
jgi:hypothetical protein